MGQLTRRYARHLLLLVPLTWPGFLYGLWQHRRRLWLSLPKLPAGRRGRQVLASPALRRLGIVGGSLAAGGMVVFLVGRVLDGLPRSTGLSPAGGDVIHATDFLDELTTIMTSPWTPAILIGHLVVLLVGLASGYLRMSEGLSKWIVIILLGGVGISGILSMLVLDTALR